MLWWWLWSSSFCPWHSLTSSFQAGQLRTKPLVALRQLLAFLDESKLSLLQDSAQLHASLSLHKQHSDLHLAISHATDCHALSINYSIFDLSYQRIGFADCDGNGSTALSLRVGLVCDLCHYSDQIHRSGSVAAKMKALLRAYVDPPFASSLLHLAQIQCRSHL